MLRSTIRIVGTGAVVLPDNACTVLSVSLLPKPARYRYIYRIEDGPPEIGMISGISEGNFVRVKRISVV